MPKPNYKLTYFNGRGRAEMIRILFEVAGVEYEDVRIKGEDWPALKAKTPFGQLPVLEIDGKEVGQSRAIARYLAREFGLYGANNREALDIDIVLELIDDLLAPYIRIFGEQDAEQKKALSKKYYDESVPTALGFLEKVLCQNKEGSGFFVGDKVSLADIVFLPALDWIVNAEHPDVLDAFPKLKAAIERIRSQDKIADWLKKRPETSF